MGVVMDFHELERLVDGIVGPLHNSNLNEVSPFAKGGLNPSAENVALHVGRSLGRKLPGAVRLVRVEVWETAVNLAVYLV